MARFNLVCSEYDSGNTSLFLNLPLHHSRHFTDSNVSASSTLSSVISRRSLSTMSSSLAVQEAAAAVTYRECDKLMTRVSLTLW